MTLINKTKNEIYQFLKKAEKYTGTDNVYLAKSGFWLALLKIISLIISLLLAVAYANFLDPVTFGNYKYILSLSTILLVFSLPGMGTALIQAIARGFEGGFYSVLKLKLKYGLLGSLAAFGLAVYYLLKGNNLLPIPLIIIGILFPFFHAFKIYSSVLTGRKLFNIGFKYVASERFISSLFLILGVILLNRIEAPGIVGLILLTAVYFFVPVIITFIFYNLIRKKFKPNKKEDPRTIPYGKQLTLMGIVGTLSQRLDQILIFHYFGAIQVAIYSFAIYPVEEISGFLGITQSLAFPKFSQKSIKDIKKTFFKKVLQLTVLGFVIMIIYIMIAPFFYRLLFPQYQESVIYSQAFAISLLVSIGLPVAAIESQAAIKERYILTLFSKIFKITLMFVLVLFYGIWGIIIGRTIAIFLSFLLSLWLVKKL